jgi:hypothetical protein
LKKRFLFPTPDSRLSSALKLSLVIQRTFAGDHFEIFMKAAEIIEAAFVTKFFYAIRIFNQQFTGMTHSKLDQKLRIGFSCS